MLVPDHPLARSLISHLHKKTKHQEGYITSSFIHQSGYYVLNGSRITRHHFNICFLCKKLRSNTLSQLMADLPTHRLEDTLPFQSVGVDCFGPFYINQGRATRNSAATCKIWVVIFVCLLSRAIHLELLEGRDTSSFVNALSRFSSIRGTSRFFRSNRGTNSVGACNELSGIDLNKVSQKLGDNNITWVMNPPHSSHFGRILERRIGCVRRVLEGALLQLGKRGLTRDDTSPGVCCSGQQYSTVGRK